MVCFTSPNEEWFDRHKYDQEHMVFYMPPWDANELFAAATALGIDSVVTRAVIAERICLFGRVARECLSIDEDFVKRRCETLEQAISAMDSLDDLTRLVKGTCRDTTHRLCHCTPVSDDPSSYHVHIASYFVKLRLQEKIDVAMSEVRNKVLRSPCGIIIEALILMQFLSVMNMNQKRFDAKPARRSTISTQRGFRRLRPLPRFSRAQYEFTSSFYYREGWFFWNTRLLLFQTTVTSRHIVVSGQGIVTVLDKLELLEKALNNPKSVRLIFAVYRSDGIRLKKNQKIEWDTLANTQHVECIPDTGPVEANQLRAMNVWTERDLRKAIYAPSARQRAFFGPDVLTRYATMLEVFDERQTLIESMLSNIPQYVWEMCESDVSCSLQLAG